MMTKRSCGLVASAVAFAQMFVNFTHATKMFRNITKLSINRAQFTTHKKEYRANSRYFRVSRCTNDIRIYCNSDVLPIFSVFEEEHQKNRTTFSMITQIKWTKLCDTKHFCTSSKRGVKESQERKESHREGRRTHTHMISKRWLLLKTEHTLKLKYLNKKHMKLYTSKSTAHFSVLFLLPQLKKGNNLYIHRQTHIQTYIETDRIEPSIVNTKPK